jgi:hypothetical protein
MQVPGTVVGGVRALRLRLLELLGAGARRPPKLLSTIFLGWESAACATLPTAASPGYCRTPVSTGRF